MRYKISALVGLMVATLGWSTSSRATNLYTPINGDSRGYTGDGTWGPNGIWRAECAINEYAKGMSIYSPYTPGTNHSGFVHGLWCYGTGSNNHVPNANEPIDVSITDSQFSPTLLREWDSGFRKAECNDYEMLSAIAQNSSGQALYGRCESASISWTSSVYATACHKVGFTNSDNRSQSNLGGDWDSGSYKNQCADDEAIKGFSVYSTGQIKSIYCCRYTANR